MQIFSSWGDQKEIVVEVFGPELDGISDLAHQIRGEMLEIEGLADVEVSAKPGKPEIVFYPDLHELSDRYIPVAAAGADSSPVSGSRP